MRFGGIVVALLLSLAACAGGDPEPREPAATSAAPTPSSTATVPPMPAQAREDSPEGAAAFVDHWVDVFNYAAATGDVTELENLSAPSCSGCQRYIDLYEETYAAGGYFKGGDWKLGDLQLRRMEDETFLTTTIRSSESLYRETSEGQEFRDPAQKVKVSFAAQRGGEWTMTQFGLGDVE